MTARFIVGDSLTELRKMPSASVDMLMCSPPFLALRSYLPADHPEKALEIGSEATPADFLDVLLDCTEEWARVLAPHGSICVELGDTYSGSGGAGGDYNADGLREGNQAFSGSASKRRANGVGDDYRPPRNNRGGQNGRASMIGGATGGHHNGGGGWPLAKSLTMIPGLYASSLAYGRNLLRPERQTDPWRVRNLVAWVRPNPPVGALGDKVRPATSYLTWACKSDKRWFDLDAVRRPAPLENERTTWNQQGPKQQAWSRDGGQGRERYTHRTQNAAGAPPLDWWCISPVGYAGSHYAVYPPELCEIPIEASCPRRVCRTCGKPSRRIVESVRHLNGSRPLPSQVAQIGRGRSSGYFEGSGSDTSTDYTTIGWTSCGCPDTDGLRIDGFHDGAGWRPGVVLDPFAGSGTTLMVATGHGRDAIGIDIDRRNLDLARQRIGMFLVEDVCL